MTSNPKAGKSNEPVESPDEMDEVKVTGYVSDAQRRLWAAEDEFIANFNGLINEKLAKEKLREQVLAEYTELERLGLSGAAIIDYGADAVGTWGWTQRWLGDALHGDWSAAGEDFAEPFVDAYDTTKNVLEMGEFILGNGRVRQEIWDGVGRLYDGSTQVSQSRMLGALPAELLIAALTAGTGTAVRGSGYLQKLGASAQKLVAAMRAVKITRRSTLDSPDIFRGAVKLERTVPDGHGVRPHTPNGPRTPVQTPRRAPAPHAPRPADAPHPSPHSPNGATPHAPNGPGGSAPAVSPASKLVRDVVNDVAPGRKAWQGRRIGKSETQHNALQRHLEELDAMGAEDIRVNRWQVDVDRRRVGVNRPDLQFTCNGRRSYFEYDTPASDRGLGHKLRIEANDPNAIVRLIDEPYGIRLPAS